MVQRCRDVNCDVEVYFQDYSNAFDMSKHERMAHAFKNAVVDERGIRIIVIYWAARRVIGQYTKSKQIQKGVHQGCDLSLVVFNLYQEKVPKKAVEHPICISPRTNIGKFV